MLIAVGGSYWYALSVGHISLASKIEMQTSTCATNLWTDDIEKALETGQIIFLCQSSFLVVKTV
jgi:hypothetical protein